MNGKRAKELRRAARALAGENCAPGHSKQLETRLKSAYRKAKQDGSLAALLRKGNRT